MAYVRVLYQWRQQYPAVPGYCICLTLIFIFLVFPLIFLVFFLSITPILQGYVHELLSLIFEYVRLTLYPLTLFRHRKFIDFKNRLRVLGGQLHFDNGQDQIRFEAVGL
jgi:hypothetical protein